MRNLPGSLGTERRQERGYVYKAAKLRGGAIENSVLSQSTGNVRNRFEQEDNFANEAYTSGDLTNKLTKAQRDRLRQFYDSCNPWPMIDLVKGNGAVLVVAAMILWRTREELFSRLIETIDAMRIALFHGEAHPTPDILKCYELAYRIVMQFLVWVR